MKKPGDDVIGTTLYRALLNILGIEDEVLTPPGSKRVARVLDRPQAGIQKPARIKNSFGESAEGPPLDLRSIRMWMEEMQAPLPASRRTEPLEEAFIQWVQAGMPGEAPKGLTYPVGVRRKK